MVLSDEYFELLMAQPMAAPHSTDWALILLQMLPTLCLVMVLALPRWRLGRWL